MEKVVKYFGKTDSLAIQRLKRLMPLCESWNSRINLISRKDFVNFEVHHVLHSLSIAKVLQLVDGTRVLDVGTGGGFPGIPLAILFPGVEFLLVDSIGKKINVVRDVATELGLKNVETFSGRAEDVNRKFDFIVSRAVTTLPKFVGWVEGKISDKNKNSIQNGILYLKGGDIDEELAETKMQHRVYQLSDFFEEPFFETKKLVHLYR